jgi:hypothetical protein
LLWTQQLVGHSQIAEPVKALKARMNNSEAAIKAALSVRLYALNKTGPSNDDTAFDLTNCKPSNK